MTPSTTDGWDCGKQHNSVEEHLMGCKQFIIRRDDGSYEGPFRFESVTANPDGSVSFTAVERSLDDLPDL